MCCRPPLQLTALNLWTNCNSATVPLVALQCLHRSDLSEWPGNSARAGVGTGCLTRLDLSSNSGLNDAWHTCCPCRFTLAQLSYPKSC